VPRSKVRLSRKERRMMRRCRGPRNWQLRRQPDKDNLPVCKTTLRRKRGIRLTRPSYATFHELAFGGFAAQARPGLHFPKRAFEYLSAARCRRGLDDEKGTNLLVNPGAGRPWQLKYRIAEVKKLISLGAYPDTSPPNALGLPTMRRESSWQEVVIRLRNEKPREMPKSSHLPQSRSP
jgi:hypothetical protein